MKKEYEELLACAAEGVAKGGGNDFEKEVTERVTALAAKTCTEWMRLFEDERGAVNGVGGLVAAAAALALLNTMCRDFDGMMPEAFKIVQRIEVKTREVRYE